MQLKKKERRAARRKDYELLMRQIPDLSCSCFDSTPPPPPPSLPLPLLSLLPPSLLALEVVVAAPSSSRTTNTATIYTAGKHIDGFEPADQTKHHGCQWWRRQ